MKGTHHYSISIKWTGNKGTGTSGYRDYDRSHIIFADGISTEIQASSDSAFLGDKSKYNPEELLVASLSSCHMLWYLHLCAEAEIIVVSYLDNATAIMTETPTGGGKFQEVTLNPIVTVTEDSMKEKANELHQRANELCFIANSVNFPVYHKVMIKRKNMDKTVRD